MMRATADQHEWLAFYAMEQTWSGVEIGVELVGLLQATTAQGSEAAVPLSWHRSEHTGCSVGST